MRYSKGPWKAEIESFSDMSGEVFQSLNIISGLGEYICNVVDGIFSNEGEVVANHKLIAAAPDLLEALQELIQVKKWKDWNGKDEHYEKAKIPAWENARLAIAKATGEDPR